MRRWLLRLFGLAASVVAVVALRATYFAPQPVAVTVVEVARGRVEETVTNSKGGTVKARQRAQLSPELGGRVVAIPHRQGKRVSKGVVLLRLDDARQRAQLRLSERELEAAKAQRQQACLSAEQAARELTRNQALAERKIISENLLDRSQSTAETTAATCQAATAGLERARAAIEVARTELDKTVLRAPFDGVIAELTAEVGEWITPSPPALPVPAVLDLIDTSSIYLSAPMDEVDSAKIHPGQRARVTIDPYPGQTF
ncbi:MAG: efflux RND transporter periplasmic adaptor subunit, partial [Acidobacteriota bacterium]